MKEYRISISEAIEIAKKELKKRYQTEKVMLRALEIWHNSKVESK